MAAMMYFFNGRVDFDPIKPPPLVSRNEKTIVLVVQEDSSLDAFSDFRKELTALQSDSLEVSTEQWSLNALISEKLAFATLKAACTSADARVVIFVLSSTEGRASCESLLKKLATMVDASSPMPVCFVWLGEHGKITSFLAKSGGEADLEIGSLVVGASLSNSGKVVVPAESCDALMRAAVKDDDSE